MKIKRFDNIWIMGLILSGTILVMLYVVKLLFPSFIIETAQNEKICLIGNYIDRNAANNILKIALSGREEEPVDTCATKAH